MSVDVQITLVMTVGLFAILIGVNVLNGKNIVTAIKNFIQEII